MAPWRAVLEHPVQKSALKTDIATGFFTLDPLMTQNFISLCQKLTVKRRVLQQITGIQ